MEVTDSADVSGEKPAGSKSCPPGSFAVPPPSSGRASPA